MKWWKRCAALFSSCLIAAIALYQIVILYSLRVNNTDRLAWSPLDDKLKAEPTLLAKDGMTEKTPIDISTAPKTTNSSPLELTEPAPRTTTTAKPVTSKELRKDTGGKGDSHITSFSACVLFNEDDSRLPEWLAYHYFTLHLRQVVIAVDPRSPTRPNIEEWRGYMNITVWDDKDFGFAAGKQGIDINRDTLMHRKRQAQFYGACTKFLQRQKATWTIFTDTDEYLGLNEQYVSDAHKRMEQVDSVLNMLNELRSRNRKSKWIRRKKRLHFLNDCIVLHRALYTAVPSTAEEIANNVPSFLNASSLDTMRWRYRTMKIREVGQPKSLFDVSKVSPHVPLGNFKTHRPVAECRAQDAPARTFFLIHHYLGNWQQYSARSTDSRKGGNRSWQAWKYRSQMNDNNIGDDVLRGWIGGFVNMVGKQAAQELLEGAGVIDGPAPIESGHWKLMDVYVKGIIDQGRGDDWEKFLRNASHTSATATD